MLLTDPRLLNQHLDYGILIPIRPSKIVRVLEHLDRLPALRGLAWKQAVITESVSRLDLARVHSPAYLDTLYGPGLEAAVLEAYELIGPEGRPHRYDPSAATKPLPRFFEDTALLQVAGTIQTCRLALERGFAFFTGGGMHHAHADRGSGFCLVNDLVIAVRKLQSEGLIRGAWIVDVDAHKGDGTGSLCRNDPSILTLSIHMARGWPLDPPTAAARGADNPSLIPNDVEIGQEEGEDHLYLTRLEAGLLELEALGRAEQGGLPDLVLVVDGADPYEKDELPSTSTMRLSLGQMLERDLLLDRFFTERGLPAAWVNAGGYGDQVWQVYAQFLERVLPEKLA